MKKLKTLILLFSLPALGKISAQTYTFNYTGGVQTWTVPSGVTSVTVDALGASGGGAGPISGLGASTPGKGGRTQATLTVTPGTVLDIYVGGAGLLGTASGVTGGYNGGGTALNWGYTYSGGSGGGASDIRVSPYGLTNRVLVAAGGGGAGWDGGACGGNQPGGDGGGLSGATVTTCDATLYSWGYTIITHTGGGTQTAGGTAGWICCGGYSAGTAGSLGNGGTGSAYGGIAAGGGGGYYGGGGGCWMGGGGGSSYTDATLCSGVTLTSGYNSGNGQVIITVVCSGGTITGPSTVCAGSTITLADTTGSSSGTWSSSSTSVATVGATTGIVTGVSSGTATITYTVTLGCGTVTATTVVTVNAVPVISGALSVCAGNTTSLSSTCSTTPSWSSSNTAIATVGATTGVVTGVSSGTATITCGCSGCNATATFTVNPQPATITGTANVCVGQNTTLSSTTSGGTWSSASTGIATVGSSTGVVTGVASGTAVISYVLPAGCYVTRTVTVNPLPTSFSFATTICAGATTTATGTPGGGTWLSGTTSVATIGSSSGLITGVSVGTTSLTYTLSTGCFTASGTLLTVNAAPASISGSTSLCIGGTTTLTDGTSGGTWSSTTTSVATVGSGSGLVSAVSTGSDTIRYTLSSGCSASLIITVNPLPALITGVNSACLGGTSTMSDLTSGGTWTSGATSVATIGSTSGVVTTVSVGTAAITYTLPSGCTTTTNFTVNPNPSAITGAGSVCAGSTITVADGTSGGAWSSSNTAIATVGSSSGLVSGIAGGTAVISYTLITGCYATATVTVNPLPAVYALYVGSSGVFAGCPGSHIILASSGLGISYSLYIGATLVTLIPGTGSSIDFGAILTSGTYTIVAANTTTGCVNSWGTVTINPTPATITGPTAVCAGGTITESDATTGGTWNSSATSVATIGSGTGVVSGLSAGVTTISYILSTGCAATALITVNPNPPAITGTMSVCVGSATTLSDATAGGTWSCGSSILTIGGSTGVVSGVSAGTALVTYTLPTGCYNTALVTVNPLPAPIAGLTSVCVGLTVAEYDLTSGGTWSSSNPLIASVGAGSGIVTGVAAGTATISYSFSTGCSSTLNITVNPVPAAISGPLTVCVGSTVTLGDITPGGIWSSGASFIASVGSTGIVTGVSGGTAVIMYSLGSGCAVTATVTVNTLPAPITGPTVVCAGATITIFDAASGGTWSSGNPTIATAGASTGLVTGITGGVAAISYTMGTGCYTTRLITVNPSPTLYPVTGGGSYCAGGTGAHIGLAGSSTGVHYQLYLGGSPVGIPVSGTGLAIDFGAFTIPGTYTVVATDLLTACFIGMTGSATISISPLPSAFTVSGGGNYCAGGAGLPVVCNLTTPGINYQLFLGTTPVGAPIAGTGSSISFGLQTLAGTYTVVATNPATGCMNTMLGSAVIAIDPLPAAIVGPTALCAGTTISLTDASAGGAWTSSTTAFATVGLTTGVVSGIATGVTTITYTLVTTGCYTTEPITVSVTPGPISGPASVCVGQTITMSDVAAGGIWECGISGLVSVGSLSGTVTGVSSGTPIITYTLGTGCTVYQPITVNPIPAAVTGITSICIGGTATLTDATPFGTWSSSAGAVATITGAGLVTGISAGTSAISYTVAGCPATAVVTVNTTPTAIVGPASVCMGYSITLTDPVAGGTWSSSSAAVTVGSAGTVTGVSGGTAVITYAIGACSVTKTITVNPTAPIAGGTGLCIGTNTILTDPITGGSWTSSAPGIAAAGLSSGLITGVSVGAATITYTLPTTCYVTTVVTVNTTPTAIAGPAQVCVGASITLTNGAGGGTWSSTNTAVAAIGSSSGILTGISAGTSVISYSLGSGCFVITTITVNPLPAAISGASSVCLGLTSVFTDATPGGTWSSSPFGIAGVTTTTGIVTGISTGVATISYTLTSSSCYTTTTVNITPAPGAITGPAGVCAGQDITLSNPVPGGTWTSSTTSVATVGSVSGIVSGISAGAATISYTIGGCLATTPVTVIALPPAIGGPGTVCVGQNITLTDPATGGTWSSSLPAIATINPGTGIMTGVSSGTVIISYTLLSGCTRVTSEVVNPVSPILGSHTVCAGLTTVLNDTSLGGHWSSSAPTIATVGSGSGVVSGISAGTAVITYLLTTGCVATATMTVNPAPPPVTGTASVCVAQTTTLSDAAIGGAWSSGNASVATVGSTGIVTGVSAGAAPISYVLGTGCPAVRNVTVNPLPMSIIGPGGVCIGSSISLTDPTPGGAWTSGTTSVATIGSASGLVSSVSTGTTTIGYTISATGCATSRTITVNPGSAPVTGTLNVCVGATTALSCASPGGAWTSINPTVANVNSYTGVVTGITPGAVLITYTLSTGCAATVVVTVNPLPGPITGPANVCAGSSVTLSDVTTGGSWSSGAPSVATIVAGTGVLTGVASGLAAITYATGSGCIYTTSVLVNPLPAPITGITSVCLGYTTALSDASPFGTWTSSGSSVAPVSSTGVVTGASLGTATITYTLPTGCATTTGVTVNPFPAAIAGVTNVCVGATTTLSDAVGGGTWSSMSGGIATVGSSSGIVTGVSAGATAIVYSLSAGCSIPVIITVNPLPSPITGPHTVCAAQAITLSDATTGGTWSSADNSIATVGSSTGNVSGISVGSVVISYTATCTTTYTVTVNEMPGPITGSTNVCLGGTTTLHDTPGTGTWLSSSSLIASIGTSSGIVTGNSVGSCTIIYQLGNGCAIGTTIHVVPLPAVFGVTGGGNHCSGDTGVHIGLTGSSLGVNYMLYRGATAVGAFAGAGTPLDFGLQTVADTYTVVGTSVTTGCSSNMSGYAFVGVIPSVIPTVTAGTPADTVCAGATATFAAVATDTGSAPAYVWSINGYPVSLARTYTYIPANGDVVTIKMTSNHVCAIPAVVTGSVTMTVQPFVKPVVTIASSPSDTVCRGTSVTIYPTPVYGGHSPIYYWFRNGTPAGSAPSFTFLPNDGDAVYCVMNSNYACRLANADTGNTVIISVDTPVYPMVTIGANPGTKVGMGVSDTLTAIVVNAVNPSYQWYINGVPVPAATNRSFVSANFSYPDQDSVSCVVTNNGVCTITSHQWVYIQVSGVGVPQIKAGSDFVILPNPNKGTFTIKGSLGAPADEEVSLEITDVLGQVVYKNNVVAKNGKLNEQVKLTKLANSMYILTLRTGSDIKVFHIVIEQ